MYHLDRIPNPYAHLDKDRDLSRLSADISYEDKAFLRRIFPEKGLFNRLTQVFFHSLVIEAKQLNITYYTPENVEHLIELIRQRCEPGRCTATQLTGQKSDGYDAGRIARVCDGPAGSHEFVEHPTSEPSKGQSSEEAGWCAD